MRILKNRTEAGELLANELLKKGEWENTLILALPRGGVPIACVIAKRLSLPWDLLFVKKIGAPNQEEFAIGAISEDGHPVWDQRSVSHFDLTEAQLQSLANASLKKIVAQAHQWRPKKAALSVLGKNILIVDDGLATGLTMIAAVEILKHKGANKISVAVPVASSMALRTLSPLVDEVFTLHTPTHFSSVGEWYQDFKQVSDAEVSALIEKNLNNPDPGNNTVVIDAKSALLMGELLLPKHAKGIVIFAHGSGSTHKSPRNQLVAKALNRCGFGALLFDLLTPEESKDRNNVFDISLLSERLLAATQWVRLQKATQNLPIAYFGASTGAAAALTAASYDQGIQTVVSRGGRPDMASEFLKDVQCPVLLVVGGEDHLVIELNKKAKEKLSNSEMLIIPHAGHLFQEPGTLDQVISSATDWFQKIFDNSKIKASSAHSSHFKIKSKGLTTKVVQAHAHSLISEKDFKPLIERLSQSRIVMLGEASHGTEEFYQLRKEISKKLIEDYGFNFIAVEGDWPDCYRLNQYIHKESGKSAHEAMSQFKRWPTWMWGNEQVEDLIEWMRGKNVGFYGLDVYSLYESLDVIKSHLKKISPQVASQILNNYTCLESFNRDEVAYSKSLIHYPEGCEREIIENLQKVLRLRLEETQLKELELFDFHQNAKIIRDAERYYRAMLFQGADSWNIRDEHMLDTLDSLLRLHGPHSKGIVWAHNTHIGDYHATDMVEEGYVNLGGLAREKYGMKDTALVGFGTYQGQVFAGRAWGARPEVMILPPARVKSHEDLFHRAALEMDTPSFYLLMDGEETFREKLGHRAVGVVYQSEFEEHGRNYVPTSLSERYDAFIFVDQTTALRSIARATEKGKIPETWPVGI